MPNAGTPASWVPSDSVMIGLLRFSLQQETRERIEAQRRERLANNVTDYLIRAAREAGREQERVIDALRAELAETMTHRDEITKELVRVKLAAGRSGIREWLPL